jgi:AraC-like DNA-binding protein
MNVKVEKTAIPLDSRLSEFASHFVSYTFHDSNEYYFVPEGCFEILFQLEDCFLNMSKGDCEWSLRPTSFVGGLHSEFYRVKSIKEGATCIGIQLKPQMAGSLLNESLLQFRNKVSGLEEILGDSVKGMVEQIRNESDNTKRFHLLAKFLIQKSSKSKSRLSPLMSEYIQQNPFVSVDQLASNFSISYSHLRKLFYDEVGLSPKEYIKVIRTRKAIGSMEKGEHNSLTDLAYKLGYFDQSHFIRDFKSVTKRSPKEYARQLAN